MKASSQNSGTTTVMLKVAGTMVLTVYEKSSPSAPHSKSLLGKELQCGQYSKTISTSLQARETKKVTNEFVLRVPLLFLRQFRASVKLGR